MTAAVPLPAKIGERDAGSSSTLRASDETSIAHARAELLSAFVDQLNASQIRYCLLTGFEGYPAVISSDVDFMVHPSDAGKIVPLLLEVARQCGALLVQSIQHETSARYFVLAKQVGNAVAYLHPDCTTDYRRDGRLWLKAEPVLHKRQTYKSFVVPAVADEFVYYLVKKVLKQQITGEQLGRLRHLYTNCAEECCERMRRFWSKQTIAALVSALMREDIGWLESHLAALLRELRKSDRVEGWWQRAAQRMREWLRCMERAANPTGVSIAICGGNAQLRADLAITLENNLRPAFRRTRILDGDSPGQPRRSAWPWLAKVRSTLVIRKRPNAEAKWFARDEIRLELGDTTDGHGAACDKRADLDGSRLLDEMVRNATQSTLEYMAKRLQIRVKVESALSPTMRAVD